MRKALLAALLLAVALGGATRAAAFGKGDVGTSGAQFLKIAPGARAAAMGEAFAGIADDVHSIYYNPAGLANLRRVEFAGMHDARFQGVSYDFAALSTPLLAWTDQTEARVRYGVAGLAVYSLSVDDIERRGTTETDAAIETFQATDFAYALAYGYRVPDTGLALGGAAKFVDSKIDGSGAASFAADLGALYRRQRVGFGGGIRNLGGKHKFAAEADPLPAVLYAGIGYKPNERWILGLELDAPRDNNISAAFGGEYRRPFAPKLSGAVRAGYNTRNTDPGGLSGASLGAGLTLSNFGLDFAFVPFGDLGNAYKFSLLVKF